MRALNARLSSGYDTGRETERKIGGERERENGVSCRGRARKSETYRVEKKEREREGEHRTDSREREKERVRGIGGTTPASERTSRQPPEDVA